MAGSPQPPPTKCLHSLRIKRWCAANDVAINPHHLLDTVTFGTICHAGYEGCFVNTRGQVTRCNNPKQKLFELGNIEEGTFALYHEPLPCLAQHCNCRLYDALNLIRHGQVNIDRAKALASGVDSAETAGISPPLSQDTDRTGKAIAAAAPSGPVTTTPITVCALRQAGSRLLKRFRLLARNRRVSG